jgi:eukaryotic-like serine/threonine-protein kinase
MVCPSCGADNLEGARVCRRCRYVFPEPVPQGAQSPLGGETVRSDSSYDTREDGEGAQNAKVHAVVSTEGFTHHAGERIGVYLLEEPLGTGSFAEVWKALETTANRHVALKVFFDHVMMDPEQAAIFRHEAQKQGRLEHERVTPIYYCHLDPRNGPGPYYIAMKFMPGGTLDGLLRQKTRLPAPEAVAIVRDVLQGLDFAHNAGIIHRDIKPRNVLLDRHGKAALADFGIAKDLSAESRTRVGTVMGTPGYMSPEQSMGQPVTRASDIYSVGVLVYEMLAGQLPYRGSSEIAIVLARKQGAPPPLHREVPGVSSQLESVVLKCLEDDPLRRFSDCQSLLHALDAAMQSAPVEAAETQPKRPAVPAPASGPPPAAKPAIPAAAKPIVSAAAPARSGNGQIYAVAGVVVLLLVGGGWWLKTRQTPPAAIQEEHPATVAPATAAPVPKTDPSADLKAVTDWTQINWDNPLLSHCQDYQPCTERLRLVERLKASDFAKVARGDPIRKDCAGWSPCLKVFPPEVAHQGTHERPCTMQVAEFDLPATCPPDDAFCKSCKQKQGVPDGTGMQR